MTFRVLSCYTNMRPETYRALVKYVPIGHLELVNVTGNVSNYWHELRRRWTGHYDLITVEQDNVIRPEMIPSLMMCDEPWCVYEYIGPPYMDDRRLTTSLGCTRFSNQLLRDIPHTRITERDYFSWHLIDYRIGVVLRKEGYAPHVHGEIEHLHDYSEDPVQVAKERALNQEALRKGAASPERAFAAANLSMDDAHHIDCSRPDEKHEACPISGPKPDEPSAPFWAKVLGEDAPEE